MNAEKFIKKEAKTALSGNWVVGIMAVMVLCFIPIIAVLIVNIAYALATGVNDVVSEALKSTPKLVVFFILFHLLAVVAVLFLSPLMNGFVRIFSSLAEKKKAEFSDLFYFFESKEMYIKAVKFMTYLIVRGVLILVASEIPAAILFAFSGENEPMLGLTVVLAVVGAMVTFVLLHRYIFAIMLFSYNEFGVNESFYIGAQVAKGHTKALVKLAVTFIPWLLTTFFVIPFLYVYPYMTCSYFVSAKYLYQQYTKDLENVITSNGMIPEGFAGAGEKPTESLVNYVSQVVTSNSAENTENNNTEVQAVTLAKESDEENENVSVSEETTENNIVTEESVNVTSNEGGKVAEDL